MDPTPFPAANGCDRATDDAAAMGGMTGRGRERRGQGLAGLGPPACTGRRGLQSTFRVTCSAGSGSGPRVVTKGAAVAFQGALSRRRYGARAGGGEREVWSCLCDSFAAAVAPAEAADAEERAAEKEREEREMADACESEVERRDSDVPCPVCGGETRKVDYPLRPRPEKNGEDASSALGKAYCERCDDTYFWMYRRAD